MKRLLLACCFIPILSGCMSKGPAKDAAADERDYLLADSISFDRSIIDELRAMTPATFSRMMTAFGETDADGHEKSTILKPNALEFEFEEAAVYKLIDELKDSFKQKGYLIFRSSQNFGNHPDKIAVLKSNDQFDILKYKATNGDNYNIGTDSVIAKLRQWHVLYPFEIVGADFDWVEARFINPPADFNAFAQDVYTFCPDVVDQGTETVAVLATEMEKANAFYLWWD